MLSPLTPIVAFSSSSLIPTSRSEDDGCFQLGMSMKKQCQRHPNSNSDQYNQKRRAILSTISSALFLPMSSNAVDDYFDDVTPMNELTKQLRTSVVRGAQIIDKIDGKWERFSDDLHLGKERNKPKVDGEFDGETKRFVKSTSDVGAFDETFAFAMLEECDKAFISCFNARQEQSTLTKEKLLSEINNTMRLVRKSFFPSSKETPTKEQEYNFECYSHFRVYNEMLVQQKVAFPPFQKQFQSIVGRSILQLAQKSLVLSALNDQLQNAIASTDIVAQFLLSKGIITSWERSIPSDDDVEEFSTSTSSSTNTFYVSSDVKYTLALNGDITLNSQLLLQELGYRLYPSFGRWLLQQCLFQCFPDRGVGEKSSGRGEDVTVVIDDYYMDTSYNSNPDLFEVKQVLLNIVIQRD